MKEKDSSAHFLFRVTVRVLSEKNKIKFYGKIASSTFNTPFKLSF